jgi:hypothetical protein
MMSDRSVKVIVDGAKAIARLSADTTLGRIAALIATAGIEVLTGSKLEAMLKAGWQKLFHEPLPMPDPPMWVGFLLLATAIGTAIIAHIRQPSADKAVAPIRIVAIKHMSLERIAIDLAEEMLPPALYGAKPQTVEIDQTPFYREGVLNVEAAVATQAELPIRIAAMAQAMPDAAFAYMGKAHIPLAILAGHSISTGTKITFFELSRNSMARWLPLSDESGPNLGIQVLPGAQNENAADAIVRVSVSFPVRPEDIWGSAPTLAREWHLTITRPKLDPITTAPQVAELAMRFRSILDDVKANHPLVERIHVFCAAPMSVCFAFGQQITKTIHPTVLVYNFVAFSKPKYPWALVVNAPGPGTKIIHLTPATA